MPSRNADPVLGPLLANKKSVDKRTWEGKWTAAIIDDIVEAVDNERRENAEALTAMQEKTARATQELEMVKSDMEMLQLDEEINGYEHKFKPARHRFSVGEIQEAMIRLRVAGAGETTPVRVSYDEIEANTRLPLPPTFAEEREARKERAAEKRKQFWTRLGIGAGLVTAGPLVVLMLVKVYLMALGALI